MRTEKTSDRQEDGTDKNTESTQNINFQAARMRKRENYHIAHNSKGKISLASTSVSWGRLLAG